MTVSDCVWAGVSLNTGPYDLLVLTLNRTVVFEYIKTDIFIQA